LSRDTDEGRYRDGQDGDRTSAPVMRSAHQFQPIITSLG
jgi:hypothetical protein